MWLLLFTRWIACYSGKMWRTELMIIVYIRMYTALLEQSVLPLSNWFILSIYFCSVLLSCLMIHFFFSNTHCIVTHNSLCGVRFVCWILEMHRFTDVQLFTKISADSNSCFIFDLALQHGILNCFKRNINFTFYDLPNIYFSWHKVL